MSSFTKSFSTTTPAGSDRASDLDTILQDDKAAIKERLALEHHDLTASTTKEASNAPGRLRPGLAGVILECSSAERQAIKDTLSTPATIVDGRTAWGPGKGAVVRDSTSGKLYIWDSGLSDWKQLDSDYRTPTGSSAYLTNTYLSGWYFPLSLSTIGGVNGQDQLNALFGTSSSIKFSDTRNTFLSLTAVLKSTAFTSWLFGATLAATASGTRAPCGAFACQLDASITNSVFNTGSTSIVVPAGMYFKFQVFYQTGTQSKWQWTGERASVFVAEIQAAFATFNVCAFML